MNKLGIKNDIQLKCWLRSFCKDNILGLICVFAIRFQGIKPVILFTGKETCYAASGLVIAVLLGEAILALKSS